MSGPLSGVKVIEIGSIGPGPFAAMVLADLGADVIRLERGAGAPGLGSGAWNVMHRNRPSVGVDLKHEEGRELVLTLCESADALVEGFRPGVMERLGLGPEEAGARNPKLVYGRMTGYGQDGPMAGVAGHDINYISVGGALGQIKRDGEKPLFPMNLVGDFGGGGMLLAIGVLAALLEARESGRGQVVDAAMIDGTALLTTMMYGLKASGVWANPPGGNLLDSGAHFYEVYETGDGGHMAVGAIEPQFYTELLRILEIPPEEMFQYDQAHWPEFKERIQAIFKTKSTQQWIEAFEHAEACTTAVYGFDDAPQHPHNIARQTFVEHTGVLQPAPAPRFSRTPAEIRMPASDPGADTDVALAAWGIDADHMKRLREAGAIG